MGDTRVRITYEVPTASGKIFPQSRKTVVATSLVEAEDVLDKCKEYGYNVVEIVRDGCNFNKNWKGSKTVL